MTDLPENTFALGDLANRIVQRAAAVQTAEDRRVACYDWHTRALAALAEGRVLDLPSTNAEAGWYRTRKGEALEIRPDNDLDLWGRINDGKWLCSLDDAWQAWVERYFSSACRHPVTREAFDRFMAGEPWPDVDQFVHTNPTPGIGHNSGPMGVDAFTDQAESACAGAEAYKTIEDDETAGRAQSLRSRLGELQKAGREQRDVEEAPLKAAYDECHAKWMGPLNKVADAAKNLREALTAWENRKLRAEREAREAAKKAAPEAAKVIDATSAPVKRQVRGGYGRAAAVKTIFVARIVDQDAAYAALRDKPEVAAVILKLANKIVGAGGSLPGVEAVEERKVA